MSQALVSVVIPCFNSEKWIEETLNSVFNQTYSSMEVITVDDGSNDNTKSIILNYGKPIKYVSQSNKGPSVARNTGIKEASGKYIAFLDSDDLWEVDKLSKQVNFLEKNQDVALVFSNVKVVNEKGDYLYTHFNKVPKDKKELIRAFFLGKIGMNTPTIVARKAAIVDINGFDEDLPVREDHFFLMSIAEKYLIHHFEEPLVKRRINETSMTQSVKAEKLFSINEPFIKKSIAKFPYLKNYSKFVYSNINMSVGNAYWKKGDRRETLKYMVKSLKYEPFVPRKYFILLLVITGIKNRSFQKIKLKLRSK
ncbi:glycosyltransferase [Rossellomorea aquimaris]|uniref:Glycosyltransferase involved in cell wall biosynthesis n=1 Tax=Rossellomorea aquimaris TaxID=189382 RepID=A0A366EQN7_9BACI|nr:glycosyltransferase [Rossellomorea aquimaris]RBP04717.1 glycosyltransferase involved in cell wall biosynthesis [Rossellomorea aquimaris]